MNIDFPHLIVTIVLIFTVAFGLSRITIYKEASKAKRILLMAITLFIVLTIFNLIWA